MVIFARPADIRSSPILMGWVLPGPIKNRIGFGFKKKKLKLGSGFGNLNPVISYITKIPIYIYIY